jgi:HSP20 family protein
MADLVTRTNGQARGVVPDWSWGLEPFRGFFGTQWSNNTGVDVHKTESGWTIEMAVPGYKPEQIDVTVEDRVLTVTGKNERRSFQRSILIPEEVDAEGISAKVEYGLLTLGLQLHPKAQPRKIQISYDN